LFDFRHFGWQILKLNKKTCTAISIKSHILLIEFDYNDMQFSDDEMDASDGKLDGWAVSYITFLILT
jgi:hypothetical protein